MEGYLHEKRGVASKTMFGSGKVFKQRWCVLQGQNISIYDDFILADQKPKGIPKTIVRVAGHFARPHGVTSSDSGQKHLFEVLHIDQMDSEPGLHADSDELEQGMNVFSAESNAVMELWVAAINEASLGDDLVLSMDQHCQVLGLPLPHEKTPHAPEATHHYRRLAMENHPDLSGGARDFDHMTRSFEHVMNWIDRKENCDKISFCCVLLKTAEHGLGLRMGEYAHPGEICVESQLPGIAVHQIDDICGSEGSLQHGDILVSIGADQTATWKFQRAKERLNDFREPSGSYVRLAFVRYVRHSQGAAQVAGVAHADHALSTMSAQEVELARCGAPFQDTDAPVSPTGSVRLGGSTTLSAKSAPGDSKAAEPLARSILKKSPSSSGGSTGTGASPRAPLNLSDRSNSPSSVGVGSASNSNHSKGSDITGEHSKFDMSISPIGGIGIAPGHIARGGVPHGAGHAGAHGNNTLSIMQKENVSLKHRIHELEKELAHEKVKSEKLAEALKSVAGELKDKNSALARASQFEQYYRIQVEEAFLNGFADTNTTSHYLEATTELNKSIANAAASIVSGRTVYPSELSEKYLRSVGLSENDCKERETFQYAQRQAVCAISSLDPTCATLRMWDAGGSSAQEKLMKLERRIQKTEASLGYSQPGSGFVLPTPKREVSDGSHSPAGAQNRPSTPSAVKDTLADVPSSARGYNPRASVVGHKGSPSLAFASQARRSVAVKR